MMWRWIVHCFKNYAVFSGRASRPEFWWFSLFGVLVGFLAALLVRSIVPLLIGVGWVIWAAMFIPQLAVMSRRLHDTDHSAWWAIALCLLSSLSTLDRRGYAEFLMWLRHRPIIVSVVFVAVDLALFIWLTVLLCSRGTIARNHYGDPAPLKPQGQKA
jgi:uncharacterized membrane protein YhaH (DUF805 family)